MSSDACTRSGAFALLLSLALVSLVPNWIQWKYEDEAYRYFTYRLKPRVPSASKSASQPTVILAPPGPPTGLAIGSPLEEVRPVIENLLALDDPRLLSDAARGSNSRTLSISRWESRRSELVTRGLARGAGIDEAIFVATAAAAAASDVSARPGSIGAITLLRTLRLRDVQELAEYELPITPSPTIRDRGLGLEVDLTSPNAVPKSLQGASLALGGLVLVVLIYFAVFALEAARSKSFPAPGTLFGAFAANRVTRILFVCFAFVPPAASIAVAIVSRSIPHGGLAIGSLVASAIAVWIVARRIPAVGAVAVPPRRVTSRTSRAPK